MAHLTWTVPLPASRDNDTARAGRPWGLNSRSIPSPRIFSTFRPSRQTRAAASLPSGRVLGRLVRIVLRIVSKHSDTAPAERHWVGSSRSTDIRRAISVGRKYTRAEPTHLSSCGTAMGRLKAIHLDTASRPSDTTPQEFPSDLSSRSTPISPAPSSRPRSVPIQQEGSLCSGKALVHLGRTAPYEAPRHNGTTRPERLWDLSSRSTPTPRTTSISLSSPPLVLTGSSSGGRALDQPAQTTVTKAFMFSFSA
jgi:hypothetical protein